MSLPPKWAMGMKYDPAENGDNETFVTSVIKQFADRGVRPDRAILEPAWQGAQYNWDTKKFPNVSRLIENIAPTKLILWEHPILFVSYGGCRELIRNGTVCVKQDGYHCSCCPKGANASSTCCDCTPGDLYAKLLAADCIAHGGADSFSAPPVASGMPQTKQFSDLTLPRCQQIWKDYQLQHAIASGAVGFKLDEDDVDVNIGFNDSAVFPSGFKGYQFHNLQGYIWQRLYHEMFESIGKRTWLQSRGGYAGSQAYPTNSYSDGYDYPTYVRGVANSGFSGLLWAPEMRHATCTSNHSASDHADFARRAQLMFLSPQAQYNAWDSHDGTTVWGPGDKGGLPCPTAYLEMFQKHFDLRSGLANYLYSAFESQSRTGLAVARPLVIDSPDDVECWRIDDQFLLGDALMFPPAATDGNPQSLSRRVYFPKTASSWHPWFDNNATAAGEGVSSYPGGSWATVPTPIMTAPLFAKGGVPISFNSDIADTDARTLQLRVWMPTTATECTGGAAGLTWSEVYDDDGETTKYKEGEVYWRARSGFAHCTTGTLALHVAVAHANWADATYQRVQWTVKRLASPPASVTCSNGAADAEAAWSHSPELHLLHIEAPLEHQCTVHL